MKTGARLALAGLARLVLAVTLAAGARGAAAEAPGVERVELATTDYAAARQFLIDAITDEGLVVSAVSDFGTMLERTDADLHHGAARYRHAEVFAFCSVQVAATLVREDLDKIANCPLTIAIYQPKGDDADVRVVFRAPTGDSPGVTMGRALLRRIVGRVTEPFGEAPAAPPASAP